jgi:transcriptional regulator with XRE-family HTH domain
VTEPPVTFAGLLRKLRTEAWLTQEELAEAAGLSPRSISDLERGVNLTARKDTARLLADALHLLGPARAQFEAVARGRAVPGRAGTSVAGATPALRTLPRDITSFTGRQRELQDLVDTAAGFERAGRHSWMFAARPHATSRPRWWPPLPAGAPRCVSELRGQLPAGYLVRSSLARCMSERSMSWKLSGATSGRARSHVSYQPLDCLKSCSENSSAT